jgi:hypothetical protein
MRISLITDVEGIAGQVFYLAGQAGVSERTHSSAADFELTPESAQEVLRFVRAAEAQPVDRGNLLQALRFTTTRQFSTAAEAWLWALDYDWLYPRTGELELDAVTGIRRMQNAVVSPPRRRVVGATVLLDYSVLGSRINAPAIGEFVLTGIPAATGTITIGSATYTFVSTLGGSAYQISVAVAVVSTAEDAVARIVDMINNGFAGGIITPIHPTVRAIAEGATVRLVAKTAGVAGNSIGISEAATNLTRSGPTLANGRD